MQLTHKIEEDKVKFYVDNIYLCTDKFGDRSSFLYVIKELKVNYQLSLAEAEAIWDAMPDKPPVLSGDISKILDGELLPGYTLEDLTLKEFDSLNRFKNAEEDLKQYQLTKEDIEGLIGEEDYCTCSHLGKDHNDEGACQRCDCEDFKYDEKANAQFQDEEDE